MASSSRISSHFMDFTKKKIQKIKENYTQMWTTTRSEIYDENGKKIYTEERTTDYKNPVFLNLQICLEKEEYEELEKECREYKTSIPGAVQDLMRESPEKLTEQYF